MFDLASTGRFLTYLTAIFGAFLAALWLSLIFWTVRDVRLRSHDRVVHILSAIVVIFFNVFGAILYFILRPRLTLDEVYQQSLEEEALLSQIESQPLCPGCGGRTEVDWIMCANCHTRLRKACEHCNKLLELPWQVCPYCANPTTSGKTVSDEEEFRFSSRVDET